jgi:hypothetical protein
MRGCGCVWACAHGARAAHPQQDPSLQKHRHKQRRHVVRAQQLRQRPQAQLAGRRPDGQRRAGDQTLGPHREADLRGARGGVAWVMAVMADARLFGQGRGRTARLEGRMGLAWEPAEGHGTASRWLMTSTTGTGLPVTNARLHNSRSTC